MPRHDRIGRSGLHQELQPVRRRRPADNAIAQGAFYEPLIVSAGGRSQDLPWLARTWKWSNGNKTLTLNLARNAKWSDGKPLTSADVVYSLTAGRQDKTMDRIGLVGEGNNIASVKAKGTYAVVIKLKTPDSQFIPAILNRAVRRPEAHLVEGEGRRDVHEPEPCRLRARSTASGASRRRTTC